MKRKRRKFTSEFKLKVILEALKERESLADLAQRYELHPNQISKWKTEFLNNASAYMKSSSNSKTEEEKIEVKELYAKIGQLQIEIDFLKKKLF